MSGIVGIWNLDGQPVEKASLGRLSAQLAHRGPDGEGLWIEGPVGLACQLFRVTPEAAKEIQPLAHSSGAILVFDGRLDNREELLARLKSFPEIAADSPDPALVLAAYQTFGDQFPERLNGDFALGLFDPARQQLLLVRDAIGIRPLYYARTQHTFLFASEIKAILAHPQMFCRPNDDTLADFLLNSARNSLGMTCFESIYSLPPSHMAILTPQQFVTRQYWDFDPSQQIRLGSFQEYAEAFREHFERAVRRRLRSASPVAVFVSGGLDSSSIFCLAETLRRHDSKCFPSAFGATYTSPAGSPSDELAFVHAIERKYGMAIEQIPGGSPGLLDGAKEAMWHVEVPSVGEQWNETFRHLLRQRGARILLTGHWGDQVLFSQAYLIDLFHRLAWGELKAHLQEFGRWMTDVNPHHIYRQFFRGLVLYHMPSALFHLLRRLRPNNRNGLWYTEVLRKRACLRASRQPPRVGSLPTVHAQSLYHEARSSYHVTCMEWNNKVAAMHGLEMAFPFLDRDLISFLMGIPGEMRTWKGVPKALLREAMGEVLPEAIAHRTWKANATHLTNEAMARDFPQLVHCLQTNSMAVQLGYLKGDVLREELMRVKDRIRGRTSEIAWTLSDLLGLELWLQVFLGENNNGRACSATCPHDLRRITHHAIS